MADVLDNQNEKRKGRGVGTALPLHTQPTLLTPSLAPLFLTDPGGGAIWEQ